MFLARKGFKYWAKLSVGLNYCVLFFLWELLKYDGVTFFL
jgi:hypothetical protein